MTHKALCDFYVASCVEDGGAYRLRLYENGKAEIIRHIPMPCPMFLQVRDNILWAILRHPFENCEDSGLAAYYTTSGERLTEISSTGGEVACHLAVSRGNVFCANYLGGSVFKTPDRLSRHQGQGIHPKRQTAPHPHSVIPSPCGQAILSCDLGLDTIFVYDHDLLELFRARVPDGHGARHAVFSKDGAYLYCINEMGGSISVFSWKFPTLTLLHTVSILPPHYRDIGSGAAIKLSKDGTYLYATERATGSIVTMKAEGEHLTVLAHTDCRGAEPRDFTLLANGRFAVCTNQFSNTISVFQIGSDGIPRYLSTIDMEAPLCAVEIDQQND